MSAVERDRLRAKAGVTLTQAIQMTGADLAYKSLLTTTGSSATASISPTSMLKNGGSY